MKWSTIIVASRAPNGDQLQQTQFVPKSQDAHILQGMKKNSKAEYVQRRVHFVNKKSSLHVNVVFSVCARMCNAAYFILSCGILFPV